MKHDPERNAASYLGGLLKGPKRKMFERHMVDCEDCWREVDLGRRGRSLAESARELTPQALRERVRAAVETATPPRRKPRWLLGGGAFGALAVALAGLMFLLPQRSPAEIDAALATFRTADRGASAQPQLPTRLADLELVRATTVNLGGFSTVAHSYVDSSGDEVVVYVADKEWPVAAGAEHDNSGETWLAEKDGLAMICLNQPKASLVVGDDVHDVELAAYSLRP